jgi:hypothetical protein
MRDAQRTDAAASTPAAAATTSLGRSRSLARRSTAATKTCGSSQISPPRLLRRGPPDDTAEFAERIGSPDRCKRLGDLGDLRRTATVLSKPERIDPSGHVVNVWTARRLNGYERLRIVRAAADCTRRAA